MKRLALVPLFFLSVGCGPVRATAFIIDADVQIQAAKTAGAEKLAPYEWTAANLYIHKAREVVGYSDYEIGVKFAEKASKFANLARENALAAAKDDAGATNTVTPVP